jgi:hypothetical protein
MLQVAAQNIKIVSDHLEDSPDFVRAQEAISNAINVVFLGFGYDQRTLSALLDKTRIKQKRFFGTAIRVESATRDMLNVMFGDTSFLKEGQDCSGCLASIGMTRRAT